MAFIGRKQELQVLNKLMKKKSASLVVISGRRRIGKSRLIEEFAKNHTFYEFSGIPPTPQTTIASQLNEFAKQLSMQTGLPEIIADDWSKLFLLLFEKIKSGRIIVLFDEITWMGSKDPDFLGKLKYAWDIYFKKNPHLIFILCGSISSWIDKNILSSTGFLGRISYRISLTELSLPECNEFWNNAGGIISPYEKLKVLAVTGGVPRYLEEIKPTLSAEENIKDLCFTKGGPLVHEFNEVFSDLFSARSDTYKKFIKTLALAPLNIQEICTKLDINPTGFISEYLKDLMVSGFITRDFTWSLNTGAPSKLSHYRLSDNYLRFYLKYIEKYQPQIERNSFSMKSLSSLPNWESIMGLQFENLVLKNRSIIKQILAIPECDIISDNPFFQRPTQRLRGCQIDYLIQTRFNTLYMCEIKFLKTEVGIEIIREMKNKIAALKMPKGLSLRPVLIHVNGVSKAVIDANFFSEIIDFGRLFEAGF